MQICDRPQPVRGRHETRRGRTHLRRDALFFALPGREARSARLCAGSTVRERIGAQPGATALDGARELTAASTRPSSLARPALSFFQGGRPSPRPRGCSSGLQPARARSARQARTLCLPLGEQKRSLPVSRAQSGGQLEKVRSDHLQVRAPCLPLSTPRFLRTLLSSRALRLRESSQRARQPSLRARPSLARLAAERRAGPDGQPAVAEQHGEVTAVRSESKRERGWRGSPTRGKRRRGTRTSDAQLYRCI